MAVSKVDVAKLYIAMFDRAPEKEGLEYWYNEAQSGKSLAEIANEMASAAKAYPDAYPQYANYDPSNPESVKAVINEVYKILFNKDASTDPDGVNYWVNEITSGKMDLGTAIVTLEKAAEEYLNSDDAAAKAAAETFVNRAAAAVKIADTLPSADFNGDGKVTATEFKVFQDSIKVVTDDSSTIDKAVETAQNEYKEVIKELPPAKIFVLTNSNNQTTGGVDNIVGTDGNDKIIGSVNATNPTFDVGDSIDGGDGFDTLYVNLAANSAPVDISNIELLQLRATAAATFDASAVNLSPDGTTFENYLSTNALTISNVASTDANFEVYNTTQNTTVTFTAAAVAGNSDELNLTLDQAGTKNASGNFITSGIETINVVSKGDAKNYLSTLGSDDDGNVDGTIGGSNLKTVNISGDQYLKISNTLFSTVKTLDASANTGGVDVDLSNSTGVDLDVKGGAGDDVVTVSTTGLTSNDKIDLGDGDDTLYVNDNISSSSDLSGIKNVENLGVKNTAATGAITIDASKIAGIKSVIDAGTNNQALTINNAPTKFTATADTTGNISITTKDLNSDLTITLDNSGTTPTDGIDLGGTITTSNTKTLTINSIGSNLSVDTTDLIDGKNENSINALLTDASTVNITGDTDLELTTTDTDIKTVDASKFTGNVRVDIQTTTDKTITTGSGIDVVTLGSAKDTVNLGAGNDYLKIASSNLTSDDKLDGGEGTDALVFTDTNGTINLNNNPETKLSNVKNFEKVLLSISTNASENTTLNLSDDAISKFGGNLTIGAFDTTNTTANSYIINSSNVNGSTLIVNTDFSNVTGNNKLSYSSGLNIDHVKGTKNNDNITVTDKTLSSSDSFDAGAGTDNLLLQIKTTGGTSSSPKQITADQLSNIKGFENIYIGDGSTTNGTDNYTKVTLTNEFANYNHNSSNTLTISFDDLVGTASDDKITLDASKVAQVALNVTDGGDKDTILLGGGDDTVTLRDDNQADTITLGAGKDTVDAHNLTIAGSAEAKITDFNFGDNTSAGKVDTLKLAKTVNGVDFTGTYFNGIIKASDGNFSTASVVDKHNGHNQGYIIVLDETAYSTSVDAEGADILTEDGANDDVFAAYVLWQDTLGNVHLSVDNDATVDNDGFAADLLVFENTTISDVAQNLDMSDLAFA